MVCGMKEASLQTSCKGWLGSAPTWEHKEHNYVSWGGGMEIRTEETLSARPAEHPRQDTALRNTSQAGEARKAEEAAAEVRQQTRQRRSSPWAARGRCCVARGTRPGTPSPPGTASPWAPRAARWRSPPRWAPRGRPSAPAPPAECPARDGRPRVRAGSGARSPEAAPRPPPGTCRARYTPSLMA